MAKRTITLTLAAALGLATSAQAMGPLRCDGRLIDRGASAAHVLYQCGEPEAMFSHTGPVRSATRGGFAQMAGYYVSEIWVYDRGVGRFPAELHFRDGILRRIDYLPRRRTE